MGKFADSRILMGTLIVTLLGTAIAYWLYVVKEGAAKEMADRKGPLWTFLYNKWFFDELYDAVFVKGAKAIGEVVDHTARTAG